VEEQFILNAINNGRKKQVYINPISVYTANEKHISIKPIEVGGQY
jgi:hypothetical protein